MAYSRNLVFNLCLSSEFSSCFTQPSTQKYKAHTCRMKKGRIALSWADERHKFPHLLIFNMRFLSSSPILVHNNCLCWKSSPRYATPPTTGVIIGSGHRTIGRKAASARGIHIEGGSILELGGIFISPRRCMDHGVGPRGRKMRPLDPEKIRFLLDLVKFNLFS